MVQCDPALIPIKQWKRDTAIEALTGTDKALPRFAEYDLHTERAYVELRANDDDGGEIIATTIFTFRSKSKLTKPQIKQEIVRWLAMR